MNTMTHPLATAVREAEDIIAQLYGASERVQAAIGHEANIAALTRNAADNYDAAEAEALSELIVQGAAKEGPLAGIATSSKAYDIALTAQRAKLRANELSHIWRDADGLRTGHERAKTARAQAEAEFAALKRVAELKTAILNALSGHAVMGR